MIAILFFATLVSSFQHEECIVTNSNDCGSLTAPTLVYPGGNTRCAFDDDSSIGTNSTYSFQVIPGSSDNVLIYFQGGGGCSSKETCNFGLNEIVKGISGSNIFVLRATPNWQQGIFNQDNVLNPYRDWTIISVMYCTADVHVGNAIIDPHDSAMKVHMNGANNAETVLKYVYKNFPSPKRLAITGSSAGALGAQAWALSIIRQYKKSSPSTLLSVVSDSFVGYFPDGHEEGLQFTGACTHTKLGMDADQLELCKRAKLKIPEFYRRTISKFPDVPFGQIVAKNDPVQKIFYCLAKFPERIGEAVAEFFKSCNVQKTYFEGITDILKQYSTPGENNNLISYLVNTNNHCFLSFDRFYTADDDLMEPLYEWMSQITSVTPTSIIPSVCISKDRSYKDEDYSCDPTLQNNEYIGMDLRSTMKTDPSESMEDDGSSSRPMVLPLVVFISLVSLLVN